MNKRTVLSWRAIASVVALSLSANLFAEITPEAKEVLEKSIEATGGRSVLESLEALSIQGSMSMPQMGVSATYHQIMVFPDKAWAKQELQGLGEIIQAYDGDTGWSQDPMQGFKMMTPDEIAAQKQGGSVHDMLNYDETYSSAAVVPSDEPGMVALQVVAADNATEMTQYYSEKSGLMEKIKMVVDMGPMGELPVTMLFQNYQPVENLVFPMKMVISNPAMTMEMNFDKYEVNPKVDLSIFAPPQ